MTTDDELPIDPGVVAPPPSELLRKKVAAMQPAPTRSPLRELAVTALGMLAWLALGFTLFRLRPDLRFLPRAWLYAVGASWLLASLAPLLTSLVPRRGQVLPDGRRAVVVAVTGWCAMLAIAVFATAHAPGHSRLVPPGRFWPLALHCCGITLLVFAGAFALLLSSVRRLVLVGGPLFGAAAGVAAGALGGFLLHLICPYADPAHVAVGHVCAVLLCAIVGGLAGAVAFSRSR